MIPVSPFLSKFSTQGPSAPLKEAIWEKEKPIFGHILAESLVLWKVSFVVDGSPRENLSNVAFVDDESLSPVKILSTEFSDVPEKGHLHIIIKAPLNAMCPYHIIPLYRHNWRYCFCLPTTPFIRFIPNPLFPCVSLSCPISFNVSPDPNASTS